MLAPRPSTAHWGRQQKQRPQPSIRNTANPTCLIRRLPARGLALSTARRASSALPFDLPNNTTMPGDPNSVSMVMKALGESVIDTIMVTNNLEKWRMPGMASSLVSLADPTDPSAARTSYRHYHGFVDVEGQKPPKSDTTWRLGPMSTLFTAVGIMQLAEHDYFALDEPLEDYLEAFRLGPRAGPPPTFRQALAHTAGFKDYGPFRKGGDIVWQRPGSPAAVPSVAAYLGPEVPRPFAPGQEFLFSHLGYAVLGQIIEDVTGVKLEEYMQENIFKPLQMHSTSFELRGELRERMTVGTTLSLLGRPVDLPLADYILKGSSSAISTLTDMEKFVFALVASGAYETASGSVRQLLSKASMAEMCRQTFRTHPSLPGVGLGFSVDDTFGDLVDGSKTKLVKFSGGCEGFSASLGFFPEAGVGYVNLCNRYDPAVSLEISQLLEMAVADSTLEPQESKPTKCAYDPKELKHLAGFYALDSQSSMLKWNEWWANGTTMQVSYLPEVNALAVASAPRRGTLNGLTALQPTAERLVFIYDLPRIMNNRVAFESTYGTVFMKIGLLSYRKM